MGTGSEREHGIFSEKTPPLGACPPFQRQGGGSAQKMGQAPSQIVFFPFFPRSDGASPLYWATVFTV